jgi:hypothetical protein
MTADTLPKAFKQLTDNFTKDLFGAWQDFGDVCVDDSDIFEILVSQPSIVRCNGIMFRAGKIRAFDEAFPEDARVRIPYSVSEPSMNYSFGNAGRHIRERPCDTAFYHAGDVEMQVRIYQGDDRGWQFYTPDGNLLTDNAGWLPEVARFQSKTAVNIVYLNKGLSRGIFAHSPEYTAIDTPVMPIVGRRNYCHFMIDLLPMLILAEKTGVAKNAAVAFSKVYPVQREICNAYGVDTATFMELDSVAEPKSFNAFRLKDAYLPAFVPLPMRLKILRDANGADSLPKGTENIFLCRKPSPEVSPRLTNQAELENVLSQHGFKIVYAEDYSVAGQKELFAKARVVVGVHGAGLTNMMFAPRSTLLVEIMNQKSHENPREMCDCFRRMCASNGQPYMRLVRPVEYETQGEMEQDSRISCPPESILRLVDAITGAIGT